VITDPATAHAVHYVFEWAALATGAWVYRSQRARRGAAGVMAAQTFPVVLGCLMGAALGNKLVFWLEYPHLWATLAGNVGAWFMGQSIVGGLLGGWIGVEIGKLFTPPQGRTGDDFVRPILCGIVVGRIGCFLAGLNDGTFGLPTDLPWAVDFGDGIQRHPTQAYEGMLALLTLLTFSNWSRPLVATSGLAFRLLMLGYLLWRLLIDGIKPVPFAYPLGWSGIQWLCLLALVVVGMGLGWDFLQGKGQKNETKHSN
jgi:phosphatidylglycerol---prolipoprotein diacylglyceryl transferase